MSASRSPLRNPLGGVDLRRVLVPSVRLIATTYLYLVGILVLWVTLTMLGTGWKPTVITSGSMKPAIHTGDVILLADPPGEMPWPLTRGEVIAVDAEGMVAEGRRLAKIDDHIVVKVPTTYEGLKATAALAAEGIAVNCTLVFSASQALLVAKAGAAYVSPFVGRLDDVSEGRILVTVGAATDAQAQQAQQIMNDAGGTDVRGYSLGA